MLPHTVYMYQRQPLPKESLEIEKAWYDGAKHSVLFKLVNGSSMAGRAQSVEVHGHHAFATAGGFPMLPHMERVVSLDWTGDQPPTDVEVLFERFSLKFPIETAKD